MEKRANKGAHGEKTGDTFEARTDFLGEEIPARIIPPSENLQDNHKVIIAQIGKNSNTVKGRTRGYLVMMVPALMARASSRKSISVMMPIPPRFAKAMAASTLGSMEPGLK